MTITKSHHHCVDGVKALKWGPYMISVFSQCELGRISCTFSMWRPMGLLSVWMQRQCSSTPRLAVRMEGHVVTKCNTLQMHCWIESRFNNVTFDYWITKKSYLHLWPGRTGAPQYRWQWLCCSSFCLFKFCNN